MSSPIPDGVLEWGDDATRTYYEVTETGEVISRPYTAEENEQADARVNRLALESKAVAATRANRDDIAVNDAFLALEAPTTTQVVEQVKALARQSSRQARQLNALARLVLGRLESTDDVIS